MVKQIFVNLAVKNLAASKEFWTKLGFTFNPQFTDEKAASLVLGENIFAMLILPSYFSTFTKKALSDPFTTTEAINAISLGSKEEVQELMKKVIAAGGTEARPTQDYGWMYACSFQDIDGHLWEPLFIDLSKAPANPGAESEQK